MPVIELDPNIVRNWQRIKLESTLRLKTRTEITHCFFCLRNGAFLKKVMEGSNRRSKSTPAVPEHTMRLSNRQARDRHACRQVVFYVMKAKANLAFCLYGGRLLRWNPKALQ